MEPDVTSYIYSPVLFSVGVCFCWCQSAAEKTRLHAASVFPSGPAAREITHDAPASRAALQSPLQPSHPAQLPRVRGEKERWKRCMSQNIFIFYFQNDAKHLEMKFCSLIL